MPEHVNAVAGARGGRQHGRTRHPVAVHEAHEVGAALLHLVVGEPVALVQHDHGDRLVRGQRRDVVVVEASIGILLGVGDPDEQVDELEHPFGLEAMAVLA